MVVFVVGLLPSQLWILRNQPPMGLFPFCSISPANNVLRHCCLFGLRPFAGLRWVVKAWQPLQRERISQETERTEKRSKKKKKNC